MIRSLYKKKEKKKDFSLKTSSRTRNKPKNNKPGLETCGVEKEGRKEDSSCGGERRMWRRGYSLLVYFNSVPPTQMMDDHQLLCTTADKDTFIQCCKVFSPPPCCCSHEPLSPLNPLSFSYKCCFIHQQL